MGPEKGGPLLYPLLQPKGPYIRTLKRRSGTICLGFRV